MHLLKIKLFCLGIISITSIAAQVQPSYVVIDETKGLQSNTIYNTYVAKNGLLYIAHSKGLSSYDGIRFTNYYNKDFPFTEVANIVETTNGSIFCKAFNNAVYKLYGDTLRWYSNSFNKLGFTPSTTFKNSLISAKNDSLQIINTSTYKNKTFALSNLSTTEIETNPIFIGKLFIGNKPSIVIVNSMYAISKVPYDKKYSQFHFSNNQIFFCADESLTSIIHFNTGEKINIQTNFKNVFINYISFENDIVWVCTTNGIFYRNAKDKGKVFTHILQGFNAVNVVQTKDKGYFVSTLDKGLLFIPNLNVNIIVQSNEKITASCIYKGQLNFANSNSKLFTYNLFEQKIKKVVNTEIAPISFLFTDSLLNIISGKRTLVNNKQENFIVKDYCYIDKNLVLATASGVYLLKSSINKNNHWIQSRILKKKQELNNTIVQLNFSQEHTSNIKYNKTLDELYISNYTGLFKLTKQDSTAIVMPEPHCVLKDICVYNGNLLLASKDKGILKWNGKTYETAFPKHVIKDIFYKFEVYENELWVLGENALYCFKNNDLQVYKNEVGVNSKNINSFSITKNNVYLNSVNTIIELPKNAVAQSNIYTNLILNKVLNTTNNSVVSNLQKLSHSNNSVLFQLSLINFTNASNTHIAYSINSNSLKHLATTARDLPLNFLQPGEYIVHFYIVSNGEVSTTPSQSFKFTIEQPFYNTWWFLSIIFLIVAIVVWLVTKWRINKIKNQLQLKQEKIILEKELDKSTLASIRSQMNPHFLFNALNTIQSYVYMNDKRNASIYISKFSDLTRSILELSNKEKITLKEEINSLETYLSLEKMRFEESFTYKIDIENSLEQENIYLPPMLLQPFVENAIKHGLLHKKLDRKLLISFSKKDAQLRICIDDNGVGRKRSQELNDQLSKNHNSFSTKANKKRLDILQQYNKNVTLQIIDKFSNQGEPLGTTVEILLLI